MKKPKSTMGRPLPDAVQGKAKTDKAEGKSAESKSKGGRPKGSLNKGRAERIIGDVHSPEGATVIPGRPRGKSARERRAAGTGVGMGNRKHGFRSDGEHYPPGEYDEKYLGLVATAVSRGATMLDIAEAIGVTTQTIHRWKREKPEFAEAIRLAQEDANDVMERSLFMRGTGMKLSATKFFFDAKTQDVIAQPYHENLAPDVGAQKLWLASKRPEIFKEAIRQEQSGTLRLDQKLTFDPAELEEALKIVGAVTAVPTKTAKGG